MRGAAPEGVGTTHQSALKDGETVNVPDWGDAPR
jgi:hypothetical protein